MIYRNWPGALRARPNVQSVFVMIALSTLVFLSLLAIGVYCYIALARMNYPFTLEWSEANSFVIILRILNMQSLYVPPGYEFVPMIHTPLYFYVTAMVAHLTGNIMFSLRLVSFLSSLAAMAMIYILGRLRSLGHAPSLIAAGMFAATYQVSGFHFDIARLDPLCLALLLMGYVVAVIRSSDELWTGIGAGVIFFLAFVTKQTALVTVPFVILYLLIERRWRKAFWLGGAFAACSGLFVALMNIISDGWFWIYTVRIPAAHPVSRDMFLYQFWQQYILPQFGWLLGLIALGLAMWLAQRDWRSLMRFVGFSGCIFVPLAIMSVSVLAKEWGYINNLMYISAAIVIIAMEAYHHLLRFVQDRAGSWMGYGLIAVASSALILQFIALRYDVSGQIPPASSREAGYRILAILRDAPDPIFIPTSPYLLAMIQQPTHFHATPLGDVNLAMRHDPDLKQLLEPYVRQINAYIASGAIKTAVFSSATWFDWAFNPDKGYYCESLITEHPPLITVNGAISYLDRVCYRIK